MFRQKSDRGKTTQIVGGLTLPGIINALYPVNSLLMTTDNVNPGTRFAGTTWVAYAAGRAIVGVGNNGENTYTGGQNFGADAVTLTAATSGAAAHTHTSGASPGYTGTISANHTHAQAANPVIQTTRNIDTANAAADNGGASLARGATSGRFGTAVEFYNPGITQGVSVNHQHLVGAVEPSSVGAVTPHENRQKSIAVYVWQRTA